MVFVFSGEVQEVHERAAAALASTKTCRRETCRVAASLTMKNATSLTILPRSRTEGFREKKWRPCEHSSVFRSLAVSRRGECLQSGSTRASAPFRSCRILSAARGLSCRILSLWLSDYGGQLFYQSRLELLLMHETNLACHACDILSPCHVHSIEHLRSPTIDYSSRLSR